MSHSDPSGADTRRKPLKKLKTGALNRSLSLARLGMIAGIRMAGHSVSNAFREGDDKEQARTEFFVQQAQMMASELGALKGSITKVGQMVAMFGEYFMPPEAVTVLRSLQADTVPVEWAVMQAVLQQELSAEVLAELDVDIQPLAAASLGQVHRATRKTDGRQLCLKIQYPGVAEAIDSDLKAMQRLFMLSRMAPTGLRLDDVFAEIGAMLHQEVDYRQELLTTEQYRQRLAADPRYLVPETFARYSSGQVLCTEYVEGIAVDSEVVKQLPQNRRNALCGAALDLFLTEFFQWRMVQTDPHFGNFLVRLAADGGNEAGQGVKQDQLVVLDFGAVSHYQPEFMAPYHRFVKAAFHRQQQPLLEAVVQMGFMPEQAPQAVKDNFAQVCFLMMEPFTAVGPDGPPDYTVNEQGAYCWGNSDLPLRVSTMAAKASVSLSFRMPPKEFVFLNRKMAGIFVFLAELGAELEGQPWLAKYL